MTILLARLWFNDPPIDAGGRRAPRAKPATYAHGMRAEPTAD
jgi:hypothetical protein